MERYLLRLEELCAQSAEAAAGQVDMPGEVEIGRPKGRKRKRQLGDRG